MDVRPLAYDRRPVGPHPATETLCPDCGNLLAVGWEVDELAAVFGPVLACALCGGQCVVPLPESGRAGLLGAGQIVTRF